MKRIFTSLFMLILLFVLIGCGLHDSGDTIENDENNHSSGRAKEESSRNEDLTTGSHDISSQAETSQQKVSSENSAYVYQVDLGDIIVSAVSEEDFYQGDNVVLRYENENNGFFPFYNIMISYTAKNDIKDFRIISYDEGIVLCIDKVEKEAGDVSSGQSIYSKQYSNDISLSTGFSFVNSFGVTEYYYLISTDDPEKPFGIGAYKVNEYNAFATVVGRTDYVEYYSFFDLDNDCSNELIIKKYDSEEFVEVGATFLFYDIVDGIATQIGEISGYNSSLVSDGEKLIVAGGHMGEEWADEIFYENGRIRSNRILEKNMYETVNGYTEWPYDIIKRYIR